MSKRPPVPAGSGRPNANDQALERAGFALQMQRPGEAERIAAEVLKANRGNVRAAQILGQALLMQNRGAEAIAPLEKAARRSEDPMLETLLGAAFALTGRRDESLEQLRRATAAALSAGVSRAWHSAGESRAAGGGHGGARKRPCARA